MHDALRGGQVIGGIQTIASAAARGPEQADLFPGSKRGRADSENFGELRDSEIQLLFSHRHAKTAYSFRLSLSGQDRFLTTYCNHSKVVSHVRRGESIAESASMHKNFGFIPDVNINIDNLY